RDRTVTGVQTCALPIFRLLRAVVAPAEAPCEMVRRSLFLVAMFGACATAAVAAPRPRADSFAKLDRELQQRAIRPRGHSRVIMRSEERRVGKACESGSG